MQDAWARRTRAWWLAFPALLLAFALRLHKLDAQSFWYDEGNSARLVERSIHLVLEGAAGDIHPPLYYLILKAWREGAGSSEAGLRSLSAFASTLTVALAFAAGRALRGMRAAWLAAWFAAVAPFSVYYAQEARMYALLALWAMLSTWAWLRASPCTRALDLLFVTSTAAGLYTHYAYPFVVAAQGLGVLVQAVSARTLKQALYPLARFVLLTVLALALFAPWMPTALRQLSGWSVTRDQHDLPTTLLTIARTLVVGHTLPTGQSLLPMLLWLGAAGVGLTALRRTDQTFWAALLLAPPVLLLGLGAYREAYLKFLLVGSAPLCVLSALGVDTLARRFASASVQRNVALLGALSLAASVSPALTNLYDNPAYARDDYRGLQRWIAAHMRAEDAVLFLAPNQWEVYTYYQGNDQNLYPLRYRPSTYAVVAQQLEAIAAAHPRFFTIYYGEREADPEGWYEQWLNQNAFKAHERWVGNLRVAVYGALQHQGLQPLEGFTPVRFGDSIALVGVRAGSVARAGDVWPLELQWQALAPITQRYTVFVHIGDSSAPPKAQFDSEPQHGLLPTTRWRVGEVVLDRRGVWLRTLTPGEAATVFIGLYDATSGTRLAANHPNANEGRLPLTTIRLAP